MSAAAQSRGSALRGPLSTRFHEGDAPPVAAAELSWYTARLPSAPGLCLQPMCSTGHLLLALLAAGVRVHGVDVSPARLEACRARLAMQQHSATLYRQDVSRLNLPLRYGAALIARGGFQWLADPHLAIDALTRIRSHLVDPGVLLLDLWVPEYAEHRPGAAVVEVRRRAFDDGTELALRSETTVDAEARLVSISSRYEHRRGAQSLAREDESLRMTWYGEEDIERLLRDAGYANVRTEPAPASATRGRRFGVVASAH